MQRVLLDLNNPVFQEKWFALEYEDQMGVLVSLGKIRNMDWPQLYQDRGLRWEAIKSRSGDSGPRVYSFRITPRARALAYREGNALCLLSLHPDHDSAYKK
jgi:hypothetical protein